ncbi:MAG: class I SAM-dependent methyltransferase [Gemmataceae bacterium]|nr:class I SAM-dependent methyltransferase [Gemmataceae bacterium]
MNRKTMRKQDHYWSQAAQGYEKAFIDPYRADVRSPLWRALKKLADPGMTVADLGCGIGPLLPFLSQNFKRVHAVDFAAGMLDRARKTATKNNNVVFHELDLCDLHPLHGEINVAIAVNSLVLPEIPDLAKALREIHACLVPGGTFVGIVPAMDAVHYYVMLLLDRALARGMPAAAAKKNAAHRAELQLYDCAFGQFSYEGLEQHFWQPFEIRQRFEAAGLRLRNLKKVHLSWKQFACGKELAKYASPWDWFFRAEVANRGTLQIRKK